MPEVRTHLKANTHKAGAPTTYSIIGILLKNHRGEEVDVQNIVVDFTITESIYSPTLILNISFKDSANFIEQYELCGQESIRVHLARQAPNSEETEKLDHTFYITEYPLYAKAGEHTQVYKMTGLSLHSYLSNLKKLSKFVEGNSCDIIASILKSDLYTDSTYDGLCVSSFSGIIPYLSPMLAIDWLRRDCYSANSSPYFIFQTAQSELKIVSYDTLIRGAVYRTYSQNSAAMGKVHGEDDYLTRSCKIHDISSNMKMQKNLSASNGAYASSILAVDIAQKRAYRRNFKYSESYDKSSKLQKHAVLSAGKIDLVEKALEDFSVHNLFIPLNSANSDYRASCVDRCLPANSMRQNSEFMTHDLRLAGDFELNAGKKVNLEIPKAVDPLFLEGGNPLDQLISGTYLVTSVQHSFSSEYYCSIRVKTDSLNYTLK